ncbi:MAG TPA: PilN domain-containing protein [Nitrospiraceae bacterium]|nr:PilN domain-containing protein [Nitrospiraceae bacterium]
MIRINLLPTPRARAVKRQWDIRLEIACAIAVLVVAVGACVYYADLLDSDIEAKQVEKQGKEKQLALLKDKVKQVQDFEQKKKLLEDKNHVIDQLEKSRSGPVRVLDYVSQSLNPLNLWLTRLSMKGNDIEVEGRALTNDDVVEFVNNLRQADYFSDIRLIESRSGSESKLNIYQFKLNFTLKA